MGAFKVVQCQSQLLQVVLGTHAVGGGADLLHSRHHQAYQNGDDGDHHQQLDQGEGRATAWKVCSVIHIGPHLGKTK